MPAIIITIQTETIKLDQFLKLAAAVEDGAEAKYRIRNGEVAVNGTTETRRGRKLVPGDSIRLAGESYLLAAGAERL